VILLLLAGSDAVIAQTITASLGGSVKDPTGAVITGAAVEVKNTETNVVTRVSTDAVGQFLAPSLPPGQYS
jgi:protocatechuate 3,4-dioxygenase beta subunit